jgi:hypothetical protein
VELGGGDWSLDVSGFGAGDCLRVVLPATTNAQAVFSTTPLNQSGVAVVNGSSVDTVGVGISKNRDGYLEIGNAGATGVCAIIVDGKLYARIALHDSSFSVDDCFALPLPLVAYREGEQVQPLSIANNVARWSMYSPLLPTRVVGFNLPTTIGYHADSSDLMPLSANGGEFGIEFTTPEHATSIDIFNGNFWLFLN